jgi:AmmeMemoRadiSam system protein A
MDATTKAALLRLARATLSGAAAPASVADVPFGGAFVTLHLRSGTHALRGCMGTFARGEDLATAVARAAEAAAREDPRFPPLGASEIDGVEIEISVLSPLRAASISELEVGRHGVVISRGDRRGVLLPQVAVERGWDRDTFLAHACIKAGLAANEWRDAGTSLEVFTAEIFAEPPARDTSPGSGPA